MNLPEYGALLPQFPFYYSAVERPDSRCTVNTKETIFYIPEFLDDIQFIKYGNPP